jgi:hypothetical protein
LTQPVGRGVVYGYNSFEVACDGTVQPWTVPVAPFFPGTKFGGGKAVSFTFGFACGPQFCAESYQECTIHLRRGYST